MCDVDGGVWLSLSIRVRWGFSFASQRQTCFFSFSFTFDAANWLRPTFWTDTNRLDLDAERRGIWVMGMRGRMKVININLPLITFPTEICYCLPTLRALPLRGTFYLASKKVFYDNPDPNSCLISARTINTALLMIPNNHIVQKRVCVAFGFCVSGSTWLHTKF